MHHRLDIHCSDAGIQDHARRAVIGAIDLRNLICRKLFLRSFTAFAVKLLTYLVFFASLAVKLFSSFADLAPLAVKL